MTVNVSLEAGADRSGPPKRAALPARIPTISSPSTAGRLLPRTPKGCTDRPTSVSSGPSTTAPRSASRAWTASPPKRAIRDAIQKTFRGAARDVQGVFAIHQHGGHDRPSHPHVHALLSPRLQNGALIHFSPRGIERVKQRWEIEVLRALQSQERRFVRREPQRELTPLTPMRVREPRGRQPMRRVEHGHGSRRLGVNTLALLRARPSRRITKLAGRTVDVALRFLDRAMQVNRNPERAARQFSLRLLSRAMPGPMRNALWLVRGIASTGMRQR